MTGFRTDSGGRIDRSRPIRFSFDGKAFEGFAGDTLASALIANGVHARITAVNSPRRLVTVDVVQLFLGKAAATAAAQDHASEVPPPNDVWIRNQSHLLRTLSVTSTAPITVNGLGAAITHSAGKNLPVTLVRLGQFPHLEDGIFWLTVRHGVVTRIAQQYLP